MTFDRSSPLPPIQTYSATTTPMPEIRGNKGGRHPKERNTHTQSLKNIYFHFLTAFFHYEQICNHTTSVAVRDFVAAGIALRVAVLDPVGVPAAAEAAARPRR